MATKLTVASRPGARSGVVVEGLDVLVRDLTSEADLAQPRAERTVVEYAARAAQRMRDTVAVLDGDVLASITSDPSARRDGVACYADAGPDPAANRQAFVARYLEYGVGAHAIRPRAARALRIGGSFAAHAAHPGHGPRPFAGPAGDWVAAPFAQAIQGVSQL